MTNKIVTFLQHIGSDLKNGLKFIAPFVVKATDVAVAAGPEIAALNPAVGAIFETTVGVVANVEQKFAALGQQSGTGPQKLADATTILTPLLSVALADAGAPAADMATIQKYISAVVGFLNAIPAPAPAAPAAPTAPAPAS